MPPRAVDYICAKYKNNQAAVGSAGESSLANLGNLNRVDHAHEQVVPPGRGFRGRVTSDPNRPCTPNSLRAECTPAPLVTHQPEGKRRVGT